MRNQVICLKDKTYRMIPVVVPLSVGIIRGGPAVDQQFAFAVAVKAADDVKQRRLAAAGGAENGNELILPESHADAS